METRALGNSGLRVVIVGLGCEGLLDKEPAYYAKALDLMEGAGANCIDLYSPSPHLRANLGEAMRGRREKFVLQRHLCTIWEDGQYKCTRDLKKVRASFEDQLERLRTDWLDIGMIHNVDSPASWKKVEEGGILDYTRGLKKQGVIRALGLSSHNPKVALKAVEEGAIEVLMFSVNPCYDLQPADEDVEQLRFPRISWKGHCMYCGHCAPCMEYIDIAMVIKFLNLAEAQNAVPEMVREYYRALPVKADACSKCGVCETRCPFDVKIRQQMTRARDVFS